MTVAVPESGAVEAYNRYAGLGLEDVKVTDLSVPRISIVGKTATFQHSVTKQDLGNYLYAVLLAQVKQRVMWHEKMSETYQHPQCKSTDFQHGWPNVDPKAPPDRQFPWAESRFNPEAGQQGRYLPELSGEVGMPALPCESCIFKDWKDGKTRCKEQHSYPLLWMHQVESGEVEWEPAILTVQGSGIKNSRQYVQSFATKGRPLFTALTLIQLTAARRGTVDYAIPSFTQHSDSDYTKVDEFADQARTMMSYLRRPPRNPADSDEEDMSEVPLPSANVNLPSGAPLPNGANPQVIEGTVVEEPQTAPPAPPAPPTPQPGPPAPPPPPPAAPPQPHPQTPQAPPPPPPAPPVTQPAAAPSQPPAATPAAPPPPPPAPPASPTQQVPVPPAPPAPPAAPPPPPAPAQVPVPPAPAPAAQIPVPPPPPMPAPAAQPAPAAAPAPPGAAPGEDLPF